VSTPQILLLFILLVTNMFLPFTSSFDTVSPLNRCPKLDVDDGAVMPDLKECGLIFDECVEKRRKEQQDDTKKAGQPRDVDMACITELEDVPGCRADTEVLYSERVRIVCKLGYGPRSSLTSTLSNTASCLSDGKFSPYRPCERKSCGVFRRPYPKNSSSEVTAYML
jgi:hypothetical protein